jgi:hypothetical protein
MAAFASVLEYRDLRRNGVAVLACLRCCDGHVVGHVLEGRVCRGGDARESSNPFVGAAVLEMHILAAGPDLHPPTYVRTCTYRGTRVRTRVRTYVRTRVCTRTCTTSN